MCPLYMSMKDLFHSDDSADMNQPPVSPRNWIPLEQPTVPYSGDSRISGVRYLDSRYLTSLQVYKSQGLDLGADITEPDHQKIPDKIIAVLKLLTFRDIHVIVQFWLPHVNGKHRFLTTIDQPFGLGALNEGLCKYRQESDRNFYVLDNDHEEGSSSPVTRVFKRGLPEWTTDLNNYTLKDFPKQEYANRCNLHGYLALPVFNSIRGLCVGVLEVLTSSGYTDYAYEVRNIHDALETVNLRSPDIFDFPALNVPNERRQKDLNKIHDILKGVCGSHDLPLAQTWAVSQHGSFVSHEKVIEKSCSSFDTRCVGKVCMSTYALPFYIKDLGMWAFLKACTERHLDRSCGLVGWALLTRGSFFCGDVTKFGEEEYPLVHDARMNRLSSCFAIFLHSVEAGDDYVLEFFLPSYIKDSMHLLDFLKTLKQNIGDAYRFELGDTSFIGHVGPPMGLYANMNSDVIQTSSDSMDDNFMLLMYSSDLESMYSSDSESRYPPATNMVTTKIMFNGYMEIFHFPISSGLSYLKNEVAQRFELEGEIILKYTDKENDTILITCDEDLNLAVDTAGTNNSINLICQPGI
ncbi:hypothetical protein R6Q59_004232 [Mikania micrantha]